MGSGQKKSKDGREIRVLRSHGQGERIFCAQNPPNPNPDGGVEGG